MRVRVGVSFSARVIAAASAVDRPWGDSKIRMDVSAQARDRPRVYCVIWRQDDASSPGSYKTM